MIKGAHLLVATPGRLFDLIERYRQAGRDQHPDPRRGGSNARHGLQATGRPHREAPELGAADHALLCDPRRRGRRAARSYTRNPGRFEADPPHSAAAGTTEHRFVSVSQDGKVDALIAELENERAHPCSSGRSGPTVWRRSRPPRSFPRSRCTETCPRVRASGRWPASTPARHAHRDGRRCTRARPGDDAITGINFDPPEDDKG